MARERERPAANGASALPAPPENLRREVRLTQLSAVFAVAVALPPWLAALSDVVSRSSPGEIASAIVTLAVLGSVVYGVVMHHLARIGYLERLMDHRPGAWEPPDREEPEPTILVPAFKEEAALVRKTLLSAALQSAGKRRVVLLIDDPPNPPRGADREALFAMRRLPEEVARLLGDFGRRCADAAARFAWRAARDDVDLKAEGAALGALYR